MRAVLDANVIASALINPSGPSGLILSNLLSDGAFELVSSPSILEECQRCLAYPRVRKRIRLSNDEIGEIVASLAVISDICSGNVESGAKCRDVDDLKYLEAALEGQAKYLVSGDDHLLEIGRWEDIHIITPREFLKILGG